MENSKKTPGLFLMELVVAPDGNDCTLWVSDVNNPVRTEGFEFVGVEADATVEVLNQIYVWIDSLGYGLVASEIMVVDLQEFGVLLGKQGQDSLWSRDFGDFVSFCAGALGMSYAEAGSQLNGPVMGLTGESRYRKMGALLLLLRKQARTVRDVLAKAGQVQEAIGEIRLILGSSGLAEEIWGKSGAAEPGE